MKTVAVLHPDHLLDRSRRGGLSPDAWRTLAGHLAACPACAWEHAATDDFARARQAMEGEAAGDAALDALVASALARAGGAPSSSALGHGPVRARRSVAPWLGAAAMVAAAIVAALLPGARPGPDRGHDSAPLAATEAGLDAGALGAPSGGDS